MKSILRIGLFGLCLLFTTNAIAQVTPRGEGDLSKRKEALTSKLDLNEEQALAFKEILSNSKAARAKITADKSLLKEQVAEQLKANRAETDRQITELLNPEQMKVFTELKDKRKSQRDVNRKENPDAEKRKAHHEEMKALRDALKPQMVALRKQFDKEIKKKDRKQIGAIKAVVDAEKEMTKKSMKDGKDMDRDARFEALKESKERMKGQREAVAEYAEKYADEIETFFEANKEVFDQYNELDKGKNRMPNKMKESSMKKKMAVKFLLMDME